MVVTCAMAVHTNNCVGWSESACPRNGTGAAPCSENEKRNSSTGTAAVLAELHHSVPFVIGAGVPRRGSLSPLGAALPIWQRFPSEPFLHHCVYQSTQLPGVP